MLVNLGSNSLLTILNKVKNKVIQQIAQLEPIDRYFQQKRQDKINEYSHKLPALNTGDRQIVRGLAKEGIYISHLDELNLDNTQQFLNSATKLASLLIDIDSNFKDRYFIKATGKQIGQYPHTLLWGLNNRLLDIAENYLSLPIACHGVYLRRDLIDNIVEKSRLWHLDKEDLKMLKIIVYLNDVSDRGGAFQYIPQKFTSTIIQQQAKYKYIPDKKMHSIVSSSEWVSCPGKRGTVIFVDTANLFHRGLLPLEAERLAVFFDYTSAIPWRPYYCKTILDRSELRFFASLFTERQKNIVFWSKKLKKIL